MKTLLVCIWLSGVLLLGSIGLVQCAYVYATSMEPTIHRYDGFLLWKSDTYKVGDIVMYRPTFLNAPYITHRIIRKGARGYTTQGDNAPYPDQESGEPEVQGGQVVGKVVTLFGHPLTIPQLGRLKQTWVGFGAIGVALAGMVRFRSARGRSRRSTRRVRRWKPLLPLAVFGIVSGMCLMGDSTVHVPAPQANPTSFLAKNRGVIPVVNVTDGARVVILGAFGERKIVVHQTGGGIQSSNIPYVLPKVWLLGLYRSSPELLRVFVACVLGGCAALVVYVLGRGRP